MSDMTMPDPMEPQHENTQGEGQQERNVGLLTKTAERLAESAGYASERSKSPTREQITDASIAIVQSNWNSVASTQKQIELLLELGYRVKDLAGLAGASTRSVARWRTGEVIKSDVAEDRINDLFSIVAYMIRNGTLGPADVVTWTKVRLPRLADQRPLAVLMEAGGWQRVRAAAEQLFDPDLAVEEVPIGATPTTAEAC